MFLVPYERIKITTDLTKQQTYDKLKENVAPNSSSSAFTEKPFAGILNEDSFKITRLASFANFYRPIVVGRFKSNIIDIRIRFQEITLVFVLIWISFFGYIVIKTLLDIFEMKSVDLAKILLFVITILILLGPLMIFKWEAKRTKIAFKKVFPGCPL